MEVLNNIYISHLLKDEEMEELVEHYHVGIESIDFSISENLDLLNENLESYKKRLGFMNCKDLILHGPFLDLNPVAFDSRIREVTLQRFEECYHAAKSLGAKKVIFHSCYIPSVYFLEGWAPRVIEFFEGFLKDKSGDIEILLENVMDPFPEPIVEIAREITHPAFGLCLDIGHANCFSSIPVQDWVKKLAPYVRHVHLHDNVGDRDAHLALGNGTIPVHVIVKMLGELQNLTYTIECNSQKDVRDSLTVLKESCIMSS